MRAELDPARRCLDVVEWPEIDREAWKQALQARLRLGEQTSPAARWRPATRHKNRRGYGRWLTFCVNSGRGTDGMPADRVTEEAVEAYLQELEEQGVALYTQRNRILELYAVMRAFYPSRDWGWLRPFINALDQHAADAQAREMPTLLTPQIVARCLEEIAAIEKLPRRPNSRTAAHYRSWLMLALLATTGIRRSNFAAITLSRHLRETSDGYLIVFERSETKTHRYAEHPVPSYLEAPLRTYLGTFRPLLMRKRRSDHLWVSCSGRPFSDHGIYLRITKLCRKAFGREINPHAFRAIGATSIAILAPDQVGTIPAFLTHNTPRTSEQHYLRATSLIAGERYADTIRELRRRLPPPDDWR